MTATDRLPAGWSWNPCGFDGWPWDGSVMYRRNSEGPDDSVVFCGDCLRWVGFSQLGTNPLVALDAHRRLVHGVG